MWGLEFKVEGFDVQFILLNCGRWERRARCQLSGPTAPQSATRKDSAGHARYDLDAPPTTAPSPFSTTVATCSSCSSCIARTFLVCALQSDAATSVRDLVISASTIAHVAWPEAGLSSIFRLAFFEL